MKIALIADILTTTALEYEADIYKITPLNYKVILKFWNPDMLFVESAWQGYKNRWKYKIANYPDHTRRNNNKLAQVVTYAKKLGIPTVFWNKEDGVHFNRFIKSAKLFEHIFTVDENCIPRYRKVVNDDITINTLMFAIQPKIHAFTGFNFKYNHVNFVGSYSQHIHENRRKWQDMVFDTVCECDLKLTIWDRNSQRKATDYRYPSKKCITVNPTVPYEETGVIYKEYLVSLNVNTVQDSETMYSRRLIEILACGGIVVSNASMAIEKYFKEYCYVVSSAEEAQKIMKRLKNGPNDQDLARAKAGAEYVAREHTWVQRLKEIQRVVGI